MAVTYPAAYTITKTAAMVLPPIASAPLSVAMLNSNAAFRIHKPAAQTTVYTGDPGITRAASYRLPIKPSADGISYDFKHVVITGTGTTAVTITVEEQAAGGGWATIYGPTASAAGASTTVEISHAAAITAGIDELRITYDRGADPATYISVAVFPGAGSPTTIQSSGFWPYDDGLLTATGAPINTEMVNRPLRNARAVVNDRSQCVLSFAQEDNGTPANVRYDMTAGSAPADEPQMFGVVTACVPFWPRFVDISVSVIATVDGGATTGLIRVRSASGESQTFDASGNVERKTLKCFVTKPGTPQAYVTFILEGSATSGRKTYLHSVAGFWTPSEPTTLLLNSVAPPASIETLATCIRATENLLMRPWCQPALFYEGNTTGLSTRRWFASIPPAVQRMNVGISRATADSGTAQADTTIATTTTSGIPAAPATSLVTVNCPTYGTEGYLDIDGSGLAPMTVWSSDSYDPDPLPGATVDRMLTPTEALAPAFDVVEITTTVGASLHYARVRPPADYQEI
jgi:hypothetical protein